LLRLAFTAALISLAAVFVVGLLVSADALRLGFDFRFQYYNGATAITNGEPLYVRPDDPSLEVAKAYVYPPPLAAALTPVTLLSRDVASVLAIAVTLASILAALFLAGVRDPRCFAIVVVTAPVWNVLETANVTGVLTLALALAWRYRASAWALATILGLAISAKIFLWPLAVWSLGTRRYSAAVRMVFVACASLLVAWSIAGFQGFTAYPDLVARLSAINSAQSYSFVGMAASLGLGSLAAHVAMVVVGGALLGLCVVLARRGEDARAFTLAVAGALALTPIMWQHYVCLLLVPLGIARPRFSAIWCLPAVLWIAPRAGNGDGIEPFLPALVAAVMVITLVAPPRAPRMQPQEAPA
jgi:hypothetical protein